MAAATPGDGGGDFAGGVDGGGSSARDGARMGDHGARLPCSSSRRDGARMRDHGARLPCSSRQSADGVSTVALSSASGFDSVVLDDEMWDIRFHFPGIEDVECKLSRSDITVLNLLALIECYGYGIRDNMYYVKEKGRGEEGMELIDNMGKIGEMIALYEAEQVLNITVLKKNSVWPTGFNREADEAEVLEIPVRYCVDNNGVTLISDDDEFVPVAMDYIDSVYVGTQQSCTGPKGVQIPVQVLSDEDEFMQELKRQKNDEEPDAEIVEIMHKIDQQRRQRADPMLHYEGDTDVDELYGEDDEESDSDVDEVPEPDYFDSTEALRHGPTSRSHHEIVQYETEDFIPSGEEEISLDELGDSDDDGAAEKHTIPCGRKRKLKKLKKRIWYDPERADPHRQFCLKLCFKDVYEFRVALRNYHIAQLRNYGFHRNTPKRIIARCTDEGREKGCRFFITASLIAHEKTFCIRKFRNEHTCIPRGEKTPVSIAWLANQSVQSMRTDPNTCVDTIIDNAKLKFGVEVPRSKAYRERQKAFDCVMGDQKAQYTRLRDYLQAILDTNPGSRCIVTTKELVEHPSPNPRFHGLFICLNASMQGFLNGCRPFIGVDGCFIKLSTGQQILAATGRDGNNNIFPVAFGVVDKEDTASWCWFLTQLKYCIGESGQFGNYTIISDRQKGLLKAISQVFPNSPQRFCLRHIYANFQSAGFRGPELKKHMDAASYSYTKNGFDLAMDAMKADCEEAYNWLAQIPPETWARHLQLATSLLEIGIATSEDNALCILFVSV